MEWCFDDFGSFRRQYHGGDYNDEAKYLQVGYRIGLSSNASASNVGFRIFRTANW
jgi:hypothetical protein